jgi:hypothetical protein
MTNLDRDSVEAERDFLLRSLDDLDAERAEGNIDDGTYQTLHDDYTARAAAAIRSLDADTDLTPEPAPAGSPLTRWLTVGGIVAFAIVAAFLLTRAVGQRHPGQTITGNPQVGQASGATGTDPGPALKAAAAAQPRRTRPHRVRPLPDANGRPARRDPRVRGGRVSTRASPSRRRTLAGRVRSSHSK